VLRGARIDSSKTARRISGFPKLDLDILPQELPRVDDTAKDFFRVDRL
jgi:hypothetical protein